MNIATLVQFIGSLGFLAFFGLLVLLVVRAGRKLPVRGLAIATRGPEPRQRLLLNLTGGHFSANSLDHTAQHPHQRMCGL